MSNWFTEGVLWPFEKHDQPSVQQPPALIYSAEPGASLPDLHDAPSTTTTTLADSIRAAFKRGEIDNDQVEKLLSDLDLKPRADGASTLKAEPIAAPTHIQAAAEIIKSMFHHPQEKTMADTPVVANAELVKNALTITKQVGQQGIAAGHFDVPGFLALLPQILEFAFDMAKLFA